MGRAETDEPQSQQSPVRVPDISTFMVMTPIGDSISPSMEPVIESPSNFMLAFIVTEPPSGLAQVMVYSMPSARISLLLNSQSSLSSRNAWPSAIFSAVTHSLEVSVRGGIGNCSE